MTFLTIDQVDHFLTPTIYILPDGIPFPCAFDVKYTSLFQDFRVIQTISPLTSIWIFRTFVTFPTLAYSTIPT